MFKRSTDHLAEMGESYTAHLGAALGIAGRLGTAAFACAVHAIIPGLFPTSASRAVFELHRQLAHRGRFDPVAGLRQATQERSVPAKLPDSGQRRFADSGEQRSGA